MEAVHSLPTMDITPLKEIGLFNTGLTVSDDFIDMVKDECKQTEWHLSKFAHREYGDSSYVQKKSLFVDPSNIIDKVQQGTFDRRLIVRQLQSSIKQEVWMAYFGNVIDRKNRITEYIYDNILKDNSKYFKEVFFNKFETDQSFLPHKDGAGTSRLYIPIYPFGEEYSRFEFYYDNQIYYIYNDITPQPVYLFNSNLLHAVFNHGYPQRVNVQISCKLPYKEALALFDESISK